MLNTQKKSILKLILLITLIITATSILIGLHQNHIIGSFALLEDEYLSKFFLFSVSCLFVSLIFLIVHIIFKDRAFKKSLQDIETLKENNEKLKNKNELLNEAIEKNDLLFKVLDNLPIGLIYYDKNSNPAYVNKKFIQMTGFTINEIKDFNTTYNILANSSHVFWETLKSGKSFLGFESCCPTKFGKDILVKTTTKYVFDSNNEVQGIIASIINITEEERLKIIEQESKLILEHISDGIITLNNVGIITGFNKGAEYMTGLNEQEVLGQNYIDIFDKRGKMFQRITSTLKIGREYNYKETINVPCCNEKLHRMVTTKSLKDENDSKIGAVCIYKNITDIEELTFKKQQSEKLVMIGQLAAGTADEIKNPLTSIRGFAQMLEQGTDERDSLRYTNYILNQVDTISEIIDEMNLLAKSAKSVLEYVSINDVITEVRLLLKKDDAKQIRINVELEKDIPNIEMNKQQLEQIITSVIENVVICEGNIGEINISSRFNKEKRQVEVIVDGDKVDIKENNILQVFKPFSRMIEENIDIRIPISYEILRNDKEKMGVILIFPLY